MNKNQMKQTNEDEKTIERIIENNTPEFTYGKKEQRLISITASYNNEYLLEMRSLNGQDITSFENHDFKFLGCNAIMSKNTIIVKIQKKEVTA